MRQLSGLRYGENPHQPAAFYSDLSLAEHGKGGIATAVLHHGKEVSSSFSLHQPTQSLRCYAKSTVILHVYAKPKQLFACCSASVYGKLQRLSGSVFLVVPTAWTIVDLSVEPLGVCQRCL